ncbi:hypothetical protein L9F63_025027, partial [Diploptera punctata]
DNFQNNIKIEEKYTYYSKLSVLSDCLDYVIDIEESSFLYVCSVITNNMLT